MSFYFFPKNYAWSQAAVISLNCGGAVGEVYPLCQELQEAALVWDNDAWYQGWHSLAERVEAIARGQEECGHEYSAGETYKRVSSYYHACERVLEIRTERRVNMFIQEQETFNKYLKYCEPEIEIVTFPYQDIEIGGHFIPAEGVSGKAPCVAFFGGLDSSIEINTSRILGLRKRGIGCLVVDGPGYGATLRLRNIPTRYDYEVVAKYVVDYLETRPDVDASRLGVLGLSFGGYYAARIAAFEKRFKTGVSWAGHWDYHEIVRSRAERAKTWSTNKTAFPSAMNQSAWVFGVNTLDEAVEASRNFRLEGVAHKIICPYLVVSGADDQLIPRAHTKAFVDAIGSKEKEHKVFTNETGGNDHCQWDNIVLGQHVIYDWFEERL